MRNILIVVISLIFVVTTTGCNNKTKSYLEGKKYINLMEEEFKATPDSSMAKINISIPKAGTNKSWKNSNFIESYLPQNILINNFDPNKQKKYSLYNNNCIHGSNYVPVIDDGMLFIVDNKNTVYGFDINNLSKAKWKKTLINQYQSTEFAGGGIAKYKNILVTAHGSNNITALNSNTGEIIWEYKLSNITRATPIIHNEHAFILTIDNKVYCFNIYSGVPKWSLPGAIEKLGIFGSASPAIAQDKVIVPHSSGQLLSIDADKGEVLWDINLIKNTQNSTTLYLNDIDMTPIINDDTIFVANYAGTFFAIDINTGNIEWYSDSVGGNKYAWYANDFIFTINKYSQLVAAYKIDGAIKWVLDLTPFEKKTKKKNKKLGNYITYSGPIMINSSLYIVSSEGTLLQVDPKNGKLMNQYSIPKDIYTPLLVSGDKAYLFNNNGSLTVIG
jgi:outer membrane protein assembly factor BamB